MISLLVGALVTARVTRLVTTDRITAASRNWLLRRLMARNGTDSLAAYLIVCDWCASFYVGLAVAAGGALAGTWSWPWLVPLGLAFSYVAGFLARGESE